MYVYVCKSEQGSAFWGLERWVTTFGETGLTPTPLPPKKMGENRQFQAKTPKYKNCNISETINRINTKFEDQAQNDKKIAEFM